MTSFPCFADSTFWISAKVYVLDDEGVMPASESHYIAISSALPIVISLDNTDLIRR